MTVAVLFHSIGLHRFRWSYQHIAERPTRFEAKLRALAEAGYQSGFFGPVDARSDLREVVLTFDDGYLDNWVHVFPVIERLGLKATIFVTPEFVDPRPVVRPQVDPASYNDVTHDPGSCCAGFLSWPELRAMENSGLVDVQSHGLTHTTHFSGPRIVDFWHPGSSTEPAGPVWMLWNHLPDLKPYYLTVASKEENAIPYGTPVYEHGNALEVPRYFPDELLNETIVTYVQQNGGGRFFDEPRWRDRLTTFAEVAVGQKGSASDAGQFETKVAFGVRVQSELAASKGIIERQLDKSVAAFCWPGGGATERTVDMARQLGYRSFTLPPKWQTVAGRALFPDFVARMGSCASMRWRGRDLGECTPSEFLWRVEAARGSRRHRLLVKASLGVRLTSSFARH